MAHAKLVFFRVAGDTIQQREQEVEWVSFHDISNPDCTAVRYIYQVKEAPFTW